MTRSISEYSGNAGNIYVQKAEQENDHPYEVWFEDFCILGDGNSEIEALQDAARHTADIGKLVQSAITEVAAHAAGGQ